MQIGPSYTVPYTSGYFDIGWDEAYLVVVDGTTRAFNPFLVSGSGTTQMEYVGVKSGGTVVAPADTNTIYTGMVKRVA